MKVNALENFRNKLAVMNDVPFMRQLADFVQRVEKTVDVTPILNECRKDGDIYILNISPYSLYFSIINGEWYFIDLINPSKLRVGVQRRDPIYNHAINPVYNHRINPNYNHTINPAYNHTINPASNHTLNPASNRTINPAHNRTINPAHNRTINPAYNYTLNPVFNHSINPNYNKDLDGLYAFSVENNYLEYYGILIPSHMNIMLIYSYEYCKPVYFAIQRASGFSIFELSNNEYVGYLESNKQEGYNWFDTNNNWIRYLV